MGGRSIVRWTAAAVILLHAAAGAAVAQLQPVRVGFLGAESAETLDAEGAAALRAVNARPGVEARFIPLAGLAPGSASLAECDVLWYHRGATGELAAAERAPEFLAALRQRVEAGAGLLLTLDALRLLPELGLEDAPPDVRDVAVNDEGYGRRRGLHAFRAHPIFAGLHGGAMLWDADADHACRQVGWFGDRVPRGRVAAVDWGYVRLYEDAKLAVEYKTGAGRVLAVGAYAWFAPPNRERRNLELLLDNCLGYLAGRMTTAARDHWTYGVPQVEARGRASGRLRPPPPRPWQRPDDAMVLRSPFAADAPWDLAGRRILVMGREPGGIEEIWTHPLMAFRDIEAALRIGGDAAPLVPLGGERPEIEIRPESVTRIYRFRRAFLKEVITADPAAPVAVVHYEYRGLHPAELVVSATSNLRLMWPYSERVWGTLTHAWDDGLGALLVQDGGERAAAVIGANRRPIQALAGRYDGFGGGGADWRGTPTERLQVGALFRFRLAPNDNMDLVMAASGEGLADAEAAYRAAVADPETVHAAAARHARDLLARSVAVTTPDPVFNEGYRWALVGADRFLADTPRLGLSLLAGFATTAGGWDGGHAVNGRPGYAWYFGRDGQWSAMALAGYGDFAAVRALLEFYGRFQAADGKILHEATTSGVVHYDAADATPLYVVLAGRYLRASGDLAFVRAAWPSITRALDFCAATDTDGDGLIENTRVGHGWVEGGALYGAHTTLYLAACWGAALEAAAEMAAAQGLADEAERYGAAALAVRRRINTDFWNGALRSLYYGKLRDGRYNTEPTVLPAVALLFGLVDAEKAPPMLDRWAGNEFSADWGVRIVGTRSALFNPRGYHTGSVWPLFTGWTALAEYRHGRPLAGFSHLMATLGIYRHWARGFVEEVLDGEVYRPSGVCPHQCWSETMVLQPVFEGMLGLRPAALAHRVELAPAFPAHWDRVSVERLRVGGHVLHLDLERGADASVYTFTHTGEGPLEIRFRPLLPAGTRVGRVRLDGALADAGATDGPDGVRLDITVRVYRRTTLEIRHALGPELVPPVPRPVPGDVSGAFRVVDAAFAGGALTVRLQGRPGSRETLELAPGAWTVAAVEGAARAPDAGGSVRLWVDFPAGDAPWLDHTVTVRLTAPPPEPEPGGRRGGRR